MSEISEAHVEWAVVDRFRQMAEERHATFNVTHSYTLFTSTLCWVMQRVRTGGQSGSDSVAASVLDQINDRFADEPPWGVYTGRSGIVRPDLHELGVRPSGEFEDYRAGDLLIALRNAVAHGDGRSVRPVHRETGRGRELVGFSFRCKERAKPVATVTLLEEDMRRITIAMAKRFCQALERISDLNRPIDFTGKVSSLVSERAV